MEQEGSWGDGREHEIINTGRRIHRLTMKKSTFLFLLRWGGGRKSKGRVQKQKNEADGLMA